MWLYDNSKLKYSPAFTEPLEKTSWHFQSQLLASKGQLVHSEGPRWESVIMELEALPGEGDWRFSVREAGTCRDPHLSQK